MSASTPMSHDVLVVEQEEQDIAVLRAAIARSRFTDCHVIGDTEEALAYLHHRGSYADATTPSLVVIDSCRSNQHGFDAFIDILSDHDLHSIPVIVVIDAEQEALPCSLEGHWSIVQRPLDQERIEALLGSLERDVFGE